MYYMVDFNPNADFPQKRPELGGMPPMQPGGMPGGLPGLDLTPPPGAGRLLGQDLATNNPEPNAIPAPKKKTNWFGLGATGLGGLLFMMKKRIMGVIGLLIGLFSLKKNGLSKEVKDASAPMPAPAAGPAGMNAFPPELQKLMMQQPNPGLN